MPEALESDGWVNFSGGMRLAEGARAAVGPDQAEVLTNATVRRGRADPRPAFKHFAVAFGEGAQAAFQNHPIQGSEYYDGPDGGRIIYVADGHVLSFNPVTREMNIVSPNGDRPFNRNAKQAYLCQRSIWMVVQDGVNPPVILEGDNATINEDPYNGVPTGMMMADGWHRLAVVAPDRRRIFISDHEYDPYIAPDLNSATGIPKPLQFTDDATYFGNARFFEVPRSLGLIEAIAFAPSFNETDDWGPLLVWCERGTRAYALQVPREQWSTQDIASTLLPTIGGGAHDSIAPRGNDVVFSDQHGRIQSFRQALATRDDLRLRPVDQPVWELYRNEDKRLRRWRRAVRFDDRILFTIRPETVKQAGNSVGVRHRGIVVMEEDHLSERPFVWSGLWTGIFPTAMDAGFFRDDPVKTSQEQCFIVSTDPDNANRIYELTREKGLDLMPEPKRVPMWVIPRWMDFERPFQRKKLLAGALHLSDLAGKITIEGYWQTSDKSEPDDWFTHHDAAGHCILFHDCDKFLEPMMQGRPRLNLPTPPKDLNFFMARPWLKFNGCVSLEEGVLESGVNASPPQTNTDCIEKTRAVVQAKDCLPNLWEDHASTFPTESELPTEVCPTP